MQARSAGSGYGCDRLTACIGDGQTNFVGEFAFQVIVENRPDRRIGGKELLATSQTMIIARLIAQRRLYLEEMGRSRQHLRGQLLQRGRVHDVETTAVRSDDQLSVTGMDGEIVDRHRGQAVAKRVPRSTTVQ